MKGGEKVKKQRKAEWENLGKDKHFSAGAGGRTRIFFLFFLLLAFADQERKRRIGLACATQFPALKCWAIFFRASGT
jgi:hypothetical protein